MSSTRSDLWNALPISVLVLDRDDRISDINPAGEMFLNASSRALMGEPVWDKVMVDIALEASLARVPRLPRSWSAYDPIQCGKRGLRYTVRLV